MTNDTTWLLKLLAALEEVRGTDKKLQTLPIQTLSTFVLISLQEGLIISDVEKRLNLASSTATRNVAVLSDRPRRGRRGTEPGHGLIEHRDDPQDFRLSRLFLTKKGRRLSARIVGAMSESAA